MLLCCTKLRNYLHHANLQGCSFHLVSNNMGFDHGQILIETETDSFMPLWSASQVNMTDYNKKFKLYMNYALYTSAYMHSFQ